MKALFCLLVVAPAALAAQQSRDTVVLDPVVVTATRIPTPASAVPASAAPSCGRRGSARWPRRCEPFQPRALSRPMPTEARRRSSSGVAIPAT